MINRTTETGFKRRKFLTGGLMALAGALGSPFSIASGSKKGTDSQVDHGSILPVDAKSKASQLIDSICKYLSSVQEKEPGAYFGSIWSEKAYHGPLLDYNAGGAHHYRGAGSGGLALFEAGLRNNDKDLLRQAEHCFDWLSVGQHTSGGYFEIQNNEKPSDWEGTGKDECSTIETAFAVNGLGFALLQGLPPKKQYLDCIKAAAFWQLELELIPNSGIFPHHDRSPWDTLNANMHAAETLALSYHVLKSIYGKQINLFQFGAERAIRHTLTLQWENGCFPYRASGSYNGATINYTSVVLWCLFNVKRIMPQIVSGEANAKIEKAWDFLVNSFEKGKGFKWEENEYTTAKYNIWTYAITASVLLESKNPKHISTANDILDFLYQRRSGNGLLPMRDRGEVITECAYMQADVALFLTNFMRK